MFDFVRQHKRIMQLLLVILIFPSFVLFGIDGYKRFTADSVALADVDGHSVTQADLEKAIQNEAARLIRQNPGLEAKIFDSPSFKAQVLNQLIDDQVLQTAANRFHVMISDQKLAAALMSIPDLQPARDASGTINKEIYASLLAAQGLTPQAYEFRLRAGLMNDSLMNAVATTFLAESTKMSASAWSQSRDVAWTRIDPLKYLANIQTTDEELKSFYQSNLSRFLAKETIEGEWVSINLEQVSQQITIKAEDVRSYFDQNIKIYSTPEQRRARHVLIALPPNPTTDQLASALQNAERVQKRLADNPSNFELVAKNESEDTGSAKQGGDLGLFQQKDMVKPFADAAFSLKKGEISQVVRSEFGFHIIQVTDIRPSTNQPFDAVRADIEKQLRSELAQKRFSELAEQFTNMVYEQSDSLAPVAKQLGLQLRTFPATDRNAFQTLPAGLNHPKVVEALFSTESLSQKRNIAATEVGPSQLTSARVIKHQLSRQLDFEEAKSAVTSQFKLTQALSRAQLEAKALQESRTQTLQNSGVVNRMKTSGLSAKAIQAVMQQPTAQIPSRILVDESEAGIFIIEIRSVKESLDSGMNQMANLLMQRAYSDAQYQSYLRSLRRQLNVKIHSDGQGLVPASSSTNP